MATTSMSHSKVPAPFLQTALSQAVHRGFLREVLPHAEEPAIFCLRSNMVGGAS
jgi:hypothetical protein